MGYDSITCTGFFTGKIMIMRWGNNFIDAKVFVLNLFHRWLVTEKSAQEILRNLRSSSDVVRQSSNDDYSKYYMSEREMKELWLR